MSLPVMIPKKYIDKAIAIYESEMTRKKSKAYEPPNKIITMSRQYGTGGRKIAEYLGKNLNCTVWGREILDVIADISNWDYHARMFEVLDEKTQNEIEVVVNDFFGKIEKHNYFYLLPKAIYAISRSNVIILGRGAHLLLPDSFRVLIKASFETRVQNMMTFDRIDEKKARQILKKVDRQRDSFMKELAHRLGIRAPYEEFDLEVNTDRFDAKDTASIILHAFSLYYYGLKKKHRQQPAK